MTKTSNLGKLFSIFFAYISKKYQYWCEIFLHCRSCQNSKYKGALAELAPISNQTMNPACFFLFLFSFACILSLYLQIFKEDFSRSWGKIVWKWQKRKWASKLMFHHPSHVNGSENPWLNCRWDTQKCLIGILTSF